MYPFTTDVIIFIMIWHIFCFLLHPFSLLFVSRQYKTDSKFKDIKNRGREERRKSIFKNHWKWEINFVNYLNNEIWVCYLLYILSVFYLFIFFLLHFFSLSINTLIKSISSGLPFLIILLFSVLFFLFSFSSICLVTHLSPFLIISP